MITYIIHAFTFFLNVLQISHLKHTYAEFFNICDELSSEKK